jgi:hypothetical protein
VRGGQNHPENILPAIQAKLVPMMIANYAVWPIAHIINFKFVAPQQRILYINCCQVRRPASACRARPGCMQAHWIKRQALSALPVWNSCSQQLPALPVRPSVFVLFLN